MAKLLFIAIVALTWVVVFGLDEKEVFAKTIFGEAWGEPRVGQLWVAWVIKNRACINRDYWGGPTIAGVALKPGQFEPWKNGNVVIPENGREDYNRIKSWSDKIFDEPCRNDPTGGSDHFNNPTKEWWNPSWINNVNPTQKIGNHQFYKSKHL